MKISGNVFKYGSNVDTDVIIPARYLNAPDHASLASHCMEDIDQSFVKKVQKGDIMVAEWNFGCGSSREHAPIAMQRVKSAMRRPVRCSTPRRFRPLSTRSSPRAVCSTP